MNSFMYTIHENDISYFRDFNILKSIIKKYQSFDEQKNGIIMIDKYENLKNNTKKKKT